MTEQEFINELTKLGFVKYGNRPGYYMPKGWFTVEWSKDIISTTTHDGELVHASFTTFEEALNYINPTRTTDRLDALEQRIQNLEERYSGV